MSFTVSSVTACRPHTHLHQSVPAKDQERAPAAMLMMSLPVFRPVCSLPTLNVKHRQQQVVSHSFNFFFLLKRSNVTNVSVSKTNSETPPPVVTVCFTDSHRRSSSVAMAALQQDDVNMQSTVSRRTVGTFWNWTTAQRRWTKSKKVFVFEIKIK